MAVSATDTPTKLLITQEGPQGAPGTDGANGSGFSLVRTHVLNNPLSRILKRNQAVSVLSESLFFERNSIATYIDIYGDLKEAPLDQLRPTETGYRFDGESTNLFLNSSAPVTQSINLTANDYILSITGTGSVSSVDGSATDGNPLLFNNSGNINFIVAGSVDTVQLEQGSKVTSYIVTDSSTFTRDADVMKFSISDNIPNVENPFSVLFRVSSDYDDFCVIDSTPLRVSYETGGLWSVNGVTSTASGLGVVLVVFDGVDTLIYVDGVLQGTISVSYAKSSSGDCSVGARLDESRHLIGDLLDLQIFEEALNSDEAQFMKG